MEGGDVVIRTEPALLMGLVQAVIAVAVSFGLDLSPQQVGGIVALLAAAGAVFVRRQVTPVNGAPAAAPQPAVNPPGG